ncbi:vomeronasal type-1 receptor 3-like [Ctenodactylus gundi]
MASTNMTIGIMFIVQIVVGTLGNISLLSQYLFLHFSACKARSTDPILRHLMVANFLVILPRGIPEALLAFGREDFLNDLGCKLVYYIHSLGRGVCFGTTCLLSVFQAIAISPSTSRWVELKARAPRYMTTSIVLCWVLQLLLNLTFAVNITRKLKNASFTGKVDFPYCSDTYHKTRLYSTTAALISIADIVCTGLMLWASGSMVFILYRHKRQVLHIHSRFSRETRATQSILVLVTIFVCLYIVCTSMKLYLTFSPKPIFVAFTVTAFTNACFPTLCPFVLMSRGYRAPRICCVRSERSTPSSSLNKV